ncbi:MAG: hypothetical protein Q8754_03035, partial [Sweet potato little leaf phytoplasma]|nr:hypothetical protein [Sweet potato little leaf phytoplasma]
MTTLDFMESYCIDKPPFFDCKNYDVWSHRMKTFLHVIDFDILYVCENDLSKSKLNDEMFSLNARAIS